MYKRVENQSEGDAGKMWWEAHRPFWREVLAVWNDIYSQKKDLRFKEEKGNGKLLEVLFAPDEESSKQANRLKN